MSRYYLVAPKYIEEPEFKHNINVIGQLGALGNIEFRNIRKASTEDIEFDSIPMICEYALVYQDDSHGPRLKNNFTDVITGKKYYDDEENFGPLFGTKDNVALVKGKEISVSTVSTILKSLSPEDIKRYTESEELFNTLMSLAYREFQLRLARNSKKEKINKSGISLNEVDFKHQAEEYTRFLQKIKIITSNSTEDELFVKSFRKNHK